MKIFRNLVLSRVEGCEIYAYDHTIHAPPTRGRSIKYFKTGLGKGGTELKTLTELIHQNNHLDHVIDYLKVDVEGAEWGTGGLSDWMESKVLDNVNQLALELHTNPESDFIRLVGILQQLYRLGFRLISQGRRYHIL